jgi:GNAT superfamily N-acetyltransferase
MYRIRIVDASDDDIADTLADLHRLTFFDAAPLPQFELAAWWLAYHGNEPVVFAGVVPSTHIRNGGYFSRVGVLQRHRGRDLQCRLMRVIEARARRIGWDSIVSDTTDNPVSANNFIRAGYRLFEPTPCALGLGAYALLAKAALLSDGGRFPVVRNAIPATENGSREMKRQHGTSKSPAA